MIWEGVCRNMRDAMLGTEGRGNMMDDASGGVRIEVNCFDNEGMEFGGIEDVPVVLDCLCPAVDSDNSRKQGNEEAESSDGGRARCAHYEMREEQLSVSLMGFRSGKGYI